MTYTRPQQWKKEESERLRGERDQMKFIDLRLERGQVVGFRKGRRRQDVPYGPHIEYSCEVQQVVQCGKERPTRPQKSVLSDNVCLARSSSPMLISCIALTVL